MNNDYMQADSKNKGVISTIIEKLGVLDRMINGHMAVQHKPFPLACRVYNNANISIVNGGVGTLLTFNTEQRDDGGLHSTTLNTGRLTAPVDGWYQISGCVFWTANATGIRYLQININTVPIATVTMPGSAVAGANYQVISTLYYMTSGQYAELLGYQDSGGALNITVSDVKSPSFEMALIK